MESCDEFRFIFTSPTFVAEKTPKERKEFYIPRLKREKSLYGTEFLRIFDYVWNNTDKLSDVTEEVIDMISTVYQENSPELIY